MIASTAAQVYVVFAAPALFAAPILRRAFPGLPDGGASIARPAAWLLVAWMAWILSWHGAIPYGTPLVVAAALVVVASGVALAWLDRVTWKQILRERWRTILLGEAIALAVFVVFVWDVQWNGDVHPAAERFMDYAILERIGLTRSFPPADSWMAGKALQYYYYGYVVMDVLRRLAGMDLRAFFNLAIPAIFSSFSLALYGGGQALLSGRAPLPRAWRAGVAAFVGGALFGNFDFTRQILSSRWHAGRWIFYPMDWFHASRVINGTINEVPAFSVFWGDLHPYFIAFPLVVLVATLAIVTLRSEEHPFAKSRGATRFAVIALTAVFLGSLYPTNSWDFPTFTTVLLAAVAWRMLPAHALELLDAKAWGKDGKVSFQSMRDRFLAEGKGWAFDTVLVCGAIAVGAVVLYLPFHIDFGKQVGRGVRLAQRRSDAIPMLIHFAPWFLIIEGWAIAASKDGATRMKRAITLPLTAAVLVFYELALEPSVAGWVKSMGSGGTVSYVLAQGIDHLFLRGLAFVLIIAALWTMLGDLEFDEVATWEGGARILTCAALGLVLVCEFAFVRDFYGGDNERMNTVFKAYIQAWILFALGASGLFAAIWRTVSTRDIRWKGGFVAATALLSVCSLTFITLADRTRSGLWQGTRAAPRPTWDPELLFRTTLAADARAVDWIKENLPPDAVLLEATAHAYEWPSRIATFSGRLSLIGWKNHESGWRNDWSFAMEREAALQQIYKAPDLATALPILRKYGIQYVYVGQIERDPTYKDGQGWNLAKFEGWPAAYRNEKVALYRVPGPGEEAAAPPSTPPQTSTTATSR